MSKLELLEVIKKYPNGINEDDLKKSIMKSEYSQYGNLSLKITEPSIQGIDKYLDDLVDDGKITRINNFIKPI